MIRSRAHPELIGHIDRLILDQGAFDPLALLIAVGLLSGAALDDWRTGRPPGLLARIDRGEGASAARVRGLLELLEQAVVHVRGQGLVAGPGAPIRVSAADAPHALGTTGIDADRLADLLGALWRPAPDRRQPDLFQDSPDAVLAHDLASALSQQRPDAARAALARLAQACPAHPHLAQ